MGVFGVLAYIAAPIGFFTYAVIVAPHQFHKVTFHDRWKFLFIKFKPDSFWWGICYMLRTLLMCLTLVFSQTGARQAYQIFILLLVYALMLVIWWPWRHRTANLFDLLVTCVLLYICALSSSYSRRTGWLQDQIAEFAASVTFSPLVFIVFLGCYVAWYRMRPGSVKLRKAKQLQLASDCRMVFTKFVGLEKDKAQAFIKGISSQDCDVLRVACGVIVAELLGHQPGRNGLPYRLTLQDKKSGARTWRPHEPTEASANTA